MLNFDQTSWTKCPLEFPYNDRIDLYSIFWKGMKISFNNNNRSSLIYHHFLNLFSGSIIFGFQFFSCIEKWGGTGCTWVYIFEIIPFPFTTLKSCPSPSQEIKKNSETILFEFTLQYSPMAVQPLLLAQIFPHLPLRLMEWFHLNFLNIISLSSVIKLKGWKNLIIFCFF